MAGALRSARAVLAGCLAFAAVAATGCDDSSTPEAIDMKKFEERSYANPFPSLEEEWPDYGNGDPFVMRHDGRYYLYVSTKDFRVGIKAWVSDDLVNWTYAGLVTEDPVSTGAYAPEVIYWNGYFYLYTSPAGKGHYVFRSESPIGPFERITENVGMSIDGSVFVDDDGTMLFTHAGREGIVGVPMTSPSTFDYGKPILGAFLGHWTEGSMIIKRDGRYYMTLTGNHVFSEGYRVNYAVSEDSPLGPYRVPDNNPILISTQPDFNGLGHSSTVMGPDLDSYYIVYHNLVGRSAEGPPVRQMNIDRLAFNGAKMSALGPTSFRQPAPKRADFEDRLDAGIDDRRWTEERVGDGGRIVSQAQTGPVFTAEYNFRLDHAASPETRIGAIFGYTDQDHYSEAVIQPEKGTISLVRTEGGATTVVQERPIPDGYDFTKLHSIRVERTDELVRVYLDSMLKLESGASEIGAGSIGYRYEKARPTFSYTAFADDAGGTSDYETAKPIPGSIEAVHYLKGEGRGYRRSEAAAASDRRKGDGIAIRETEDGSYSAALSGEGDWLRYAVNVSKSGIYGVDFLMKKVEASAEIELLVDDERVGSYGLPSFPSSEDDASDWVRTRVGKVELAEGYHTFAVKLTEGTAEWRTIEFSPSVSGAFEERNVLERSDSEAVHGSWELVDGAYRSVGTEDAKMYGGSELWDDYAVETDITIDSEEFGQAGVLVRVTNESHFPDQVTDALMGYYVAVNDREIELYKLNYDSELLVSADVALEPNKTYRLRVEAVGGRIEAYLDQGKEPVFSYFDDRAFLRGKVGIRSSFAEHTALGDLTVTSLERK
ncbi:family 43 glycosylhydrolase [Paenibacillus antri]|nr:family 43 glycosylhydrolase [Paenibacillus antri]